MQRPAAATASAAMMAIIPESGSSFVVEIDKSGGYGYDYYGADRAGGMQQLADLSCVFNGFPAAQFSTDGVGGGGGGGNMNSADDNYNVAGVGGLGAAEISRGNDDDVDDMMRMIGSVAGGASPSTIPAKADNVHHSPWHWSPNIRGFLTSKRLPSGDSAHLPVPTATIFDPNHRVRMGAVPNYAYPSDSHTVRSSSSADYFTPAEATHSTNMRLPDFSAAAVVHVGDPNTITNSSQSTKPATTSMIMPAAPPIFSHLQAPSSSSSDSISSASAAHEQSAAAAGANNAGGVDLAEIIPRTGKRRRFGEAASLGGRGVHRCTSTEMTGTGGMSCNNNDPAASSSLGGTGQHGERENEGDHRYYVAAAGDLEFGHGSSIVGCGRLQPPEGLVNGIPSAPAHHPASAAASIHADRLRIRRRSHLEQLHGTITRTSVPTQHTTSNACVGDYQPQRHMNENIRKRKIKVEPHITNDQYYGKNIGKDIDMAKININDTNQNATINYISSNDATIHTTISDHFPMMHDNVGSIISLHLEKDSRKMKPLKYNTDGNNGMDGSKLKTSSTIVPSSSNTYNMKATWRRRSNKLSRNALGPALNTNGKPRAPQGSANDPQSIAARTRRERINARFKTLQDLVPNASKFDLATMLEKAIDYVKLLQLQLKILSDDELWKRTSIATIMRGGNGGMIDGMDDVAGTSAVPSTSTTTSIAVQSEAAAAALDVGRQAQY